MDWSSNVAHMTQDYYVYALGGVVRRVLPFNGWVLILMDCRLNHGMWLSVMEV